MKIDYMKLVQNMVLKYLLVNNLYASEVDIYAPCALGATINDDTIKLIKS